MDFADIFSSETTWDWGLVLSYDFHPYYFLETEILHKLKIKKNFTIVIDDSRYKEIVSNPNFSPNYLGVNYNLEKIKVRNGGQFHAKLYFFLSEERLNLAVGSVNLTSSGFKRNLECLFLSEYEKGKLEFEDIDMISQLVEFFRRCFINRNPIVEPVSSSLSSILQEIIEAPFIKYVLEERKHQDYSKLKRKYFFIDSTVKSLFSTIREVLGSGIDMVHILSPYYDNSTDGFNILSKTTNRAEIFIPRFGNTFPKDALENDFSFNNKFDLFLVDKIENSTNRFIHAKYYRFKKNRKVWDFITSANLTGAGFFNDTHPRNFEIGMLFLNNGTSFLDLANLEIEKLKTLDSIFPDEKKPTDELKFERILHIETALYNGNKIIIKFIEDFLNEFSIEDFKIELIIGKEIEGTYSILKNENSFFIEPSLEIEGNKLIQIRLISDKIEDFEDYTIYVNRSRHSPSYLPALGASSFNKCVKIGGIEGLKKAFELAKNSGRRDWLVYLLSHWNLEKILVGLNKEAISEDPQTTESDDTDTIPSLPRSSKKTKKEIFRRNIDSTINYIDLSSNLELFVYGIEEKSRNDEEKIANYIEFCFPLFLQIGQYFKEILDREEFRKSLYPQLQYPEYTWLENYNKNKVFLAYIFEKLKELLRQISLEKIKNKNNYYHFLALSFLWTKVHTEKTIKKFTEIYEDFHNMEVSISNRMRNFIDKIDHKLLGKVQEEFEHYVLNPEILVSL